MIKFVIDTSAVTDPRLRQLFGVNELWEVVEKYLELMALAKLKLGFSFYTTPSVMKEIKGFLERSMCPSEIISKLGVWILVKDVSQTEAKIPARVFLEYVAEVKRRLDKGLRVAEESTRRAMEGGEIGEHIRNLREKYREATRKGLLDSVADLEAAILALELGAVLVTNDEGLCKLASKLGVSCIDPLTFVKTIEEYLNLIKRHG
ncbi:RNA ligase partner protein [Ignicoccus hospitalis]|uniref:RNA-free ribonuclease P n=1 Tax=Ignicoccus hospitalis (strain KIN4/I / DSM 18386 / JCM 14125) TaxID=453591 RepID=RFRNP_IGNH4|nr:RNA ligase partner protein [Ignicoccus hospitalis]A8A8M4.1 RecName: Full=RNA-free ribonuclease P; Short=RNA-free RNase P; AltName: Full=Protein-only RNase P [Ignicoccus hospitalis KIN4/I]ABU81276.1 DNA-binding protein containing PIN domain-like protein [Ignicoccus hospitalis KIN4/I]HIH90958.1 RNA ligase partner protein [Desulfurococcaceae archaeon]